MKNNVVKLIAALMTSMMLLGFASIFPVHATDGTRFFIEPVNSFFPPPYLGVDDTFQVNAMIANVTMLLGVEFNITWDPALLECTEIYENLFRTIMPPGDYDPTNLTWYNLWPIANYVDNSIGEAWYAYAFKSVANAENRGYGPINITLTGPPTGFPQGKLAAAKLTFKIKKAPTMAEGSVNCTIHVKIAKLGTYGGGAIAHTEEDGYYGLAWSPPVSKPYYSVEPPTYYATAVGEVFNISVKINNLAEGWEAVGFEFKLGYNSSILEVLNVYASAWLRHFGDPPNQGTLNMTILGADYVHIGAVVMPAPNGTWVAPPCFPHGDGVLAIITFNATYQGMFPEVASCPLDLYGTKVANWLAQPIAQDPAQDGFYSIKSKVTGRMIDVYIGSDGYTDIPTPYPDPFGGQGINRTADLIYPQKKIWMWAYVTYNEWPEQRKVVTFEVRDPQGGLVIVLSAITNESGIAFADFRIPWPEYEWALCHVFTIVASVDIASNTVKDWLWFHYDYVVRIDAVITDKVAYKHCENITVTVIIKSKAILPYPVTVTIVLKDELQYPFGMVYIDLTVGGSVWCTYKYWNITTRIHVHKHVRAGVATIHVNALERLPWYCGSAWCPEYVTEKGTPPEVSILAEWA